MATTRSTPGGSMLEDGYQTLIAFDADPDISFWEKTVQPPGVDFGEGIDVTTMHNTTWRTMAARALATLTSSQLTVAYDPEVYDQIIALKGINMLITVHFSDSSTLDFYGFLQTFEPDSVEEGSQPEATVTLHPTNRHPTTGAETAPNYITAAGTD